MTKTKKTQLKQKLHEGKKFKTVILSQLNSVPKYPSLTQNSVLLESLMLFTILKLNPLEVKTRRFFNVRPKRFAVIRIFVNFTNINLSITTLTGKVLKWTSGGCLDQSRRTWLTSRSVGLLMKKLLKGAKKYLRKKYVKVLFCGPSSRFHRKLFSAIKKKAKRFQMRILCREEAYRKSFNGCKSHRAKR